MYAWRSAAREANGLLVALEPHELSPTLELSHTADALRQAMRSLLNFDQFKEGGDAQSAPWGWLPPSEPSPDPAGFWVTSTTQSLDVCGRLNPGAPGWTWGSITDAPGTVLVGGAGGRGYAGAHRLVRPEQPDLLVPGPSADRPAASPGGRGRGLVQADRGGEPVRIGRWSVET